MSDADTNETHLTVATYVDFLIIHFNPFDQINTYFISKQKHAANSKTPKSTKMNTHSTEITFEFTILR